MKWFVVLDTQTGAKFNALASDLAGAQRLQALEAAKGLAGRRGTAVEGTRYTVEGISFDVAFHMEELQGAQPSGSERRTNQSKRPVSGYEQYADNWHRQFRGIAD